MRPEGTGLPLARVQEAHAKQPEEEAEEGQRGVRAVVPHCRDGGGRAQRQHHARGVEEMLQPLPLACDDDGLTKLGRHW